MFPTRSCGKKSRRSLQKQRRIAIYLTESNLMDTRATTLGQPGIDIRKLKADSIILLEAEPYLYEMRVMYPVHSIVEISSSDPNLRAATVGQVLHSVRSSGPGVPIPSWIGKGLALEIRFRNGTYRTQPVMAASVGGRHEDGSRWSYEVF